MNELCFCLCAFILTGIILGMCWCNIKKQKQKRESFEHNVWGKVERYLGITLAIISVIILFLFLRNVIMQRNLTRMMPTPQ